jgi:hypothetical protein
MREIVLAKTKEGVKLTTTQSLTDSSRNTFYLTGRDGRKGNVHSTLEKALQSMPFNVRKELAMELFDTGYFDVAAKKQGKTRMKKQITKSMAWEKQVLFKKKNLALIAIQSPAKSKYKGKSLYYFTHRDKRSTLFETVEKALQTAQTFNKWDIGFMLFNKNKKKTDLPQYTKGS